MSDFLKRLGREVLIGPGPETLRAQYDQSTEHGGWWAINHPAMYQDILRADFKMGCDYVSTGGANKFGLKKYGLQDKRREINYGTLKLAKEAIPNNCYLACTINATPFMPPVSEAGFQELYESYVEQIAIAQDIGVDFWKILGTDIVQMVTAVKAIRDNSKLPIVALLAFDPTPKGFRTMMGADPTTAAKELDKAGVDVIGTICGRTSYQETTAVLKEMRAVFGKLLAAKPNAGTPQLVNGKPVHPGTPEQIAEEAPNWVSVGARMVSGCCGTTPEHIAKVIAVLKKAGLK